MIKSPAGLFLQAQKNPFSRVVFTTGAPIGTRTLDPLIKSQLLYHLSYQSIYGNTSIVPVKSLTGSPYGIRTRVCMRERHVS